MYKFYYKYSLSLEMKCAVERKMFTERFDMIHMESRESGSGSGIQEKIFYNISTFSAAF